MLTKFCTDLLPCPVGFVYVERDLFGLATTPDSFHTDVNKCAEICELNKNCRAFQHSRNINLCKLVLFENSATEKYHDWIFCQKKGGTKIKLCLGLIFNS